MTSATLFGIQLATLYFAIAQVESNGGLDAKCRGNVYQITRRYLDDVNRFSPYIYPDAVRFDRIASERLMYDYWYFYGMKYITETGRPVTAEVLAKIHRVGYAGLKTRARTAQRYWERVRNEMR